MWVYRNFLSFLLKSSFHRQVTQNSPPNPAKRPLNLPIPQQPLSQQLPFGTNRAQTTLTKEPVQLINSAENVCNLPGTHEGVLRTRNVPSSNEGTISNGNGESGRRKEEDGLRRGTMQSVNSKETKNVAQKKKSFQQRTLSLTYNKATMKQAPGVRLATPVIHHSPSPMPTGLVTSIEVEDSYIPKIAEHTKNWSSFMARNYFRLNNIKLLNTFLINVILLMFQVGSWVRGVQYW